MWVSRQFVAGSSDWIDENGQVLNAYGNLTIIRDAKGAECYFEYDEDGLLNTVEIIDFELFDGMFYQLCMTF